MSANAIDGTTLLHKELQHQANSPKPKAAKTRMEHCGNDSPDKRLGNKTNKTPEQVYLRMRHCIGPVIP
jgi:hypothetical protein